jgi:hypothetical protein
MLTIRRNLLALVLLSGSVSFSLMNTGCKETNDSGKLPPEGGAPDGGSAGADGGGGRAGDAAAGAGGGGGAAGAGGSSDGSAG